MSFYRHDPNPTTGLGPLEVKFAAMENEIKGLKRCLSERGDPHMDIVDHAKMARTRTGIGTDSAVIVRKEKIFRVTKHTEMNIVAIAGREKTIWIEISIETDTVRIIGREEMVLTETDRGIDGAVIPGTEHMIRMKAGIETDNVRVVERRIAMVAMNAITEVTAQDVRTQMTTRIEDGVGIMTALMITIQILKHIKDKSVTGGGRTLGKGASEVVQVLAKGDRVKKPAQEF